MKIEILKELKELIPPLKAEELAQLELNILEHGVIEPLIVWETTQMQLEPSSDSKKKCLVLIDGHNRFGLIEKHGLAYEIHRLRFETLTAVKAYIIDNQLGRRNLTDEQISYLRGLRYLEQKKNRGGFQDGSHTDVAKNLGKQFGVSERTIKRDADFAKGLDKLAPPFRTKVLQGDVMNKKSLIALGQSNYSEPISTIVEVQTLLQSDKKTSIEEEKLRKRIRLLGNSNLEERYLEDLLVSVNELLNLIKSK